MNKIEPYSQRLANYIRLENYQGWRIKIYGISAYQESLPDKLVSNGIRETFSRLPQPAIINDRYGVGFLIIHQGTMRNWFLLDWWEKEDIMHHFLFSSPLDNYENITPEKDKSLIACVHELKIISFESEAWIKTALNSGYEKGFDEYLNKIYRV